MLSIRLFFVLAIVSQFLAAESQTIRIVQLGDSYASGNGGGSYEDTNCFRSANNWGNKMTDELSSIMEGDFEYTNNACSDASISALASQDSAVDSETDLVIIGVGGNDLSFEYVVKGCYIPLYRSLSSCQNRLNGASNGMSSMQSALTSALLNIRSINPDVLIILVAYPHITLDTYYQLSGVNITPQARSVGNQMDNAQRAAVSDANNAAGTEFVFFFDDTKALFSGHEAHPSAFTANNDRWVWELFTDYDAEVYHLNPTGHSELGKALAPFAKDLLDMRTPSTPSPTLNPTDSDSIPAPTLSPIDSAPSPTFSPTDSDSTPSPTLNPTAAPTASVYCSQDKDRIELSAGNERQYTCPGGASGPVHIIWRTSPAGSEGFRDDEYIIKVYQDGNTVYRSNEIFNLVGTTQLSGIVGSETQGTSTFIVEFDCTLTWLNCDDGYFEFKLVECGCPNGQAPLQPCVVNSLEDTQDAVCSNSAPDPTPAPVPLPDPAPSPDDPPSSGGGPAPSPDAPPSSGGGLCFSGLAEVSVQDKGSVPMTDVQVGDMVLTSEGYQPVYAFAHRHETKWATFLQLHYELSAKGVTGINAPTEVLEISAAHMVFVQGAVAASDDVTGKQILVRASSVKVGDLLLYHGSPDTPSLSPTPVTISKITSIQRPGVYAPLTASSTIVVNGVMASNYVRVQSTTKSDNSREAIVELSNDWVTPVREADVIHLWLSPLRLVCSLVSSKLCQVHANTSNPDGMHPYVAFGFRFVEWWEQQAVCLQLMCLFLGIGALGAIYFLEHVLVSSSVQLVATGLTLVWLRSSSSKAA